MLHAMMSDRRARVQFFAIPHKAMASLAEASRMLAETEPRGQYFTDLIDLGELGEVPPGSDWPRQGVTLDILLAESISRAIEGGMFDNPERS